MLRALPHTDSDPTPAAHDPTPCASQYPVSEWVLGRFTAAERPSIEAAMAESVATVESILVMGLEKAQVSEVFCSGQKA